MAPKKRWIDGGKGGLRMIRRKRRLHFKPTKHYEELMVAQAKETYEHCKMEAETLAKKVLAKFLSTQKPTDDTMNEVAPKYFEKKLAGLKRRRGDV
jgi:hypothetical protein